MGGYREMEQGGECEESYLPPGVAPEAVGALFRAAAALYRAKP